MGKIKLPEDVRKFFQKAGRKGGKKSTTKFTSKTASEAVKKRWAKAKKNKS